MTWEPTGRRRTYRHVESGFIVMHCGHPTALWPYAILRPAGPAVIGPNGRGFQFLRDARAAAELIARGELPTSPGPPGYHVAGDGGDVAAIIATWERIREAGHA
jgi:hypothetical protein